MARVECLPLFWEERDESEEEERRSMMRADREKGEQ